MVEVKENEDLVVIHQKVGDIKITDILTNQFMQKYTNFNSFRELTFSSLVWIDWNKEVVMTRKTLLDRFIDGSSQFGSWEEMFNKALDENGNSMGCNKG